MLENIPCTFRRSDPTANDLDKIRIDAGNPSLTDQDVIVFGRALIARTDVSGNGARFTPDALKLAAPSFVGKPLNFDHEYETAKGQIGRIFDAWTTEETNGATALYVNSYAIKTGSDADLQKKIFNRQYRELSMGINVLKAICSDCKVDVMPTKGLCPTHGNNRTITECEGDHVSFVGDEAIKGAQLLNAREKEIDPSILKLAEDGKLLREFATSEFSRWYGLNNPSSGQSEIDALTVNLSAKQMLTLARVQQSEFHKIIPNGGQQLTPAKDETVTPIRTAEEIKQSFRKGS